MQVATGRTRKAVADAIRYKSLFSACVFSCQDDALSDGRMPRERRINFSWLNAESTNLHLLVGTTLIFQIVAVHRTRQVAGAIETSARLAAERVGNEAFCRQIGTV